MLSDRETVRKGS